MALTCLRILEPNDRLPGFRNRYFIWRYDLQSGLYEQLTFGHNSTYINDVSPDSRYLLFSTSETDYTSLPHSSNSLYKLDLQTMAVDTLWEHAKYVNGGTSLPTENNYWLADREMLSVESVFKYQGRTNLKYIRRPVVLV